MIDLLLMFLTGAFCGSGLMVYREIARKPDAVSADAFDAITQIAHGAKNESENAITRLMFVEQDLDLQREHTDAVIDIVRDDIEDTHARLEKVEALCSDENPFIERGPSWAERIKHLEQRLLTIAEWQAATDKAIAAKRLDPTAVERGISAMQAQINSLVSSHTAVINRMVAIEKPKAKKVGKA